MAAALVRPAILLMPAPSAGLIRELRRLRVRGDFVRTPSCALHTVVATEDPIGERYKHVITSGQHTFRGDLSGEWGAGGTAPDLDWDVICLKTEGLCVRWLGNVLVDDNTLDRKKWPLRRVTVTVKEIGKDLHGTLPDALQMIVSLEGELTDAQKTRLIEISAKCPVKQMMLGKMRDGISVHLSP